MLNTSNENMICFNLQQLLMYALICHLSLNDHICDQCCCGGDH